jgi:hypothetical protein
VKRVEFVIGDGSESSCPKEDTIVYVKDFIFMALERMFDKLHTYHMKILLRTTTVNIGREDIFKHTTGNERLQKISNDNGVTDIFAHI